MAQQVNSYLNKPDNLNLFSRTHVGRKEPTPKHFSYLYTCTVACHCVPPQKHRHTDIQIVVVSKMKNYISEIKPQE